MAINKQRNSQKSAQNLLEAAIEVFAQRGPEAATVDQICKKAGLNKRMLYHYFGSKQQLYQQALNHMYQQLLSLDISLETMMLPVEKIIETIVRQYYMFLKNHQDFVRLICYENLNRGRTAQKLKTRSNKPPVITALQLAIKKGRAEKRFRTNIDTQKLLVSIMGLCFFYFSNEHTMKELLGDMPMTKPALEKQIKHVVDLILHGIVNDKNSRNRRNSNR